MINIPRIEIGRVAVPFPSSDGNQQELRLVRRWSPKGWKRIRGNKNGKESHGASLLRLAG